MQINDTGTSDHANKWHRDRLIIKKCAMLCLTYWEVSFTNWS